MYQALYRKWRPQTFDDVVGQKNITATLANEVENGSVTHAYLFTGSRGTGKTTCAKILAKAVNCLNPQQGNPCNACDICIGIDSGAIMDVVELDAASNNGVESIRDMVDEAVFTPVKAKYRVYIMDEAHMLTTGASNAFLKTLEEPPKHVIFILATTDPEKLLQTIRSRCQRFDFRRIGPQDIAERLQYIARQEGFTLDEDAAALIARIADGALRDAVSLLDLCAVTDKHITAAVVSAAAGLADKEFLFELTSCIKTENPAKALELVNELHASFSDMTNLCTEFINHMRNLMIIKSVKKADSLITSTNTDFKRLVKQAADFTLDEILNAMFILEKTAHNMSRGYNKRTEFELALIRLCTAGVGDGDDSILKRLSALETKVFQTDIAAPAPVRSAAAAVKTPQAKADVKQTQPEKEISQKTSTSTPLPAKPTEPSAGNFDNSMEKETPYTSAQVDPQEAAQPAPEADRQQEKAAVAENKKDSCSPPATATGDKGQMPFDLWPDVLRLINTKLPSLWAFIRSVSVFVEGDTLILCSKNIEPIEAFINLSDNLEILKLCVLETTKTDYKIQCQTLEFPSTASTQKTEKETEKGRPADADNAKASAFLNTMKKMNFNS